jgi:hypothetical protein
MVRQSAPFISGLVISGGEPTLQCDQLIFLAREAYCLGLKVCLHTSGVYPEALLRLLGSGYFSRVALDIKDSWDNYGKYLPENLHATCIEESLNICTNAFVLDVLSEFEVVFTVFDYNLNSAWGVVHAIPRLVPLVIQQGRPIDGSEPISRYSLLLLCKSLAAYKYPGCLKLRTLEQPEEIIHA